MYTDVKPMNLKWLLRTASPRLESSRLYSTDPVSVHVCLAPLSDIMRWLQLQFDGRSTAYRKSLRSHLTLAADPLAAFTLTYLFI